ncbi:Cobalamin synthesis protein [Pseudomonas cichorii]|uniref:Cobalamin synthesis protein n=1 Tax=Pseudomonas cichorii TaxID=36746 RepID=A0A3M4M6V6_PSECI|nr:GTP-binding protein [Pseudomonas cichorii]RMQ49557.1 Cobalamin synthesis protein [Pseudomonas cichorii]
MSEGVDGRTPVTLLTGFLGSGKTTILNHLLQQPELADTAVIINEFGEIGLDHLLVEQVSENLRLLQSGCLCCTVRGDLVDTLVDLHARRAQAQLPSFNRVMIETTGLADPTAILQTFMVDPQVIALYRLDQVVTAIDAVNAARTLDRHGEALRQVSLADRILLTKTDLASEETIRSLRERLLDLNPDARIVPVINGSVSAEDVLQTAPWDTFKAEQHLARLDGGQRGNSHRDGNVQSHCLVFSQPVSEARLANWLELMAMVRGESLLRVKGLVQLVEHPEQPTVIHGVQQIFHPLRQLPAWPADDRRSRIVLIVQDLDFAEITRTFEKFVGVALPKFQPLSLLKALDRAAG